MTRLFLSMTVILAAAYFYQDTAHYCIPENTLYLSADNKSNKGIDELQFNNSIDQIEKLYKPIFKKEYKSKLVVERKWDDGTVNAYAQQSGSTWKVSMFGGLARHAETTKDGFTAVVCHEVGHHIAGAPKKKAWYGSTWASNEGQSDYYATSKCLKMLFEEEEQLTLDIYNNADLTDVEKKLAKEQCDIQWSSELESASCYRSAQAGKSLARLLGSLRGNADVKFSTPDPSVVTKTDDNHPKAQCRLDTYLAGALCIKDAHLRADDENPAIGYCTRTESFRLAARPFCWYKP